MLRKLVTSCEKPGSVHFEKFNYFMLKNDEYWRNELDL